MLWPETFGQFLQAVFGRTVTEDPYLNVSAVHSLAELPYPKDFIVNLPLFNPLSPMRMTTIRRISYISLPAEQNIYWLAVKQVFLTVLRYCLDQKIK